jgi:hypothetical protein
VNKGMNKNRSLAAPVLLALTTSKSLPLRTHHAEAPLFRGANVRGVFSDHPHRVPPVGEGTGGPVGEPVLARVISESRGLLSLGRRGRASCWGRPGRLGCPRPWRLCSACGTWSSIRGWAHRGDQGSGVWLPARMELLYVGVVRDVGPLRAVCVDGEDVREVKAIPVAVQYRRRCRISEPGAVGRPGEVCARDGRVQRRSVGPVGVCGLYVCERTCSS